MSLGADAFLQSSERFLAGDADFICRLQQQGFELIDDGWNFTLPELHCFLAVVIEDLPPYTIFRQQLFKSTINTRLAEMGAVIVVANSRSKVDLSTYRLQRLATNEGDYRTP